tara:strand:- start:35 stop:301 length:267 start_codon:yes stop_codon:yes gene_type:complete
MTDAIPEGWQVCVDIKAEVDSVVSSGLYIRAFELNQFIQRIEGEGYKFLGIVYDRSNNIEVITHPKYGTLEGVEHSAVVMKPPTEEEE